MMVSNEDLARRAQDLIDKGGFAVPDSQTPWQQYFRELTGGLDTGMTLRDAPSYTDTARKSLPRDSH